MFGPSSIRCVVRFSLEKVLLGWYPNMSEASRQLKAMNIIISDEMIRTSIIKKKDNDKFLWRKVTRSELELIEEGGGHRIKWEKDGFLDDPPGTIHIVVPQPNAPLIIGVPQ